MSSQRSQKFVYNPELDDEYNNEPQYSEEEVKSQRNRTIIIVALFVIFLSIIFFTIRSCSNSSSQPNDTINISNKDKKEIDKLVNDFTHDDGTWGLIPSKVDRTNIFNVQQLIKYGSVATPGYYLDRAPAYQALYKKYATSGPLDYNTEPSQWDDSYPVENLVNFTVEGIKVNTPSTGSQLFYQGTYVPQVVVPVSFTDVETSRMMTADDASWKGSYDIMEGRYQNNMQVTVIKNNNVWKVYAVNNAAYNFPLVTWENPSDYSDLQHGFVKVGSMQAIVPKSS